MNIKCADQPAHPRSLNSAFNIQLKVALHKKTFRRHAIEEYKILLLNFFVYDKGSIFVFVIPDRPLGSCGNQTDRQTLVGGHGEHSVLDLTLWLCSGISYGSYFENHQRGSYMVWEINMGVCPR